MTTVAHAAQAAIIQHYFTPNNYIAIVLAAILGAWIDLLRLFQKDRSNWYWYNVYHLKKDPTSKPILNFAYKMMMLSMPYTNLHIIEDWFMHDSTGKWKTETYYIEVGFWILVIFNFRALVL